MKNSSGDSIWFFTNDDTVSENKTTDFLLIILVHKFGNACKILSVNLVVLGCSEIPNSLR